LTQRVEGGDIAVAADGRARRHGQLYEETVHKTGRLTGSLCIGFSGGVFHGNMVVAPILGKPEWMDKGAIFDLWEESKAELESVSYEQLKSEIKAQLERVELNSRWREAQAKGEERSSILLAGKDRGKAKLCWLHVDKNELVCILETEGHIIVGSKSSTKDKEAVEHLLLRQFCGIEKRLIDSIRYCAEKHPTVNSNVLIRRLTDDFQARWHYDDR